MRLLICGDFCPQNRVGDIINKGDFESVFGDIKSLVKSVDYSIVNFECPVTIGGESPIDKCGPNLQCSPKGPEALKWAGVNCVTLANNHFYDFGDKGVDNTLASLIKNNIDTVGGGHNLKEASQILYRTIDDSTLAVINCCEHEFSIATETTAGSNPLNPVQQYYSIEEAHNNADFVIVIVHGGNEYYQLPSPRMKELFRFFIDAGADCVVNHHQHCFSGYEVYKQKPIFYGIGNFCFDDDQINDLNWNEGYMVELVFDKGSVGFQLHPYVQCEESPRVSLMSGDRKKSFDRRILELNDIIIDEDLLKSKYNEYLEKNKDEIRLIFLPIVNRITVALSRRHLLPKFVSRKNKYKIHNLLMCESHYPKVLKFIQSL